MLWYQLPGVEVVHFAGWCQDAAVWRGDRVRWGEETQFDAEELHSQSPDRAGVDDEGLLWWVGTHGETRHRPA